ncbi:amidase family protein [Yinghuangia aomiensis]
MARFDDRALAAAEAADAALAAGDDLGPLHGIPLGIKDIITTSEAPTTAQSLVLDRAWGPGIGDAPVARAAAGQRARSSSARPPRWSSPSAGLDESKPFPIPRNPWNPRTWPGGSSSGTGAGVAAGMFLGGLGTDTGGSIRIPAACSAGSPG